MKNAPDWILVGKIRRPHGTGGETLVQSLTDSEDRFADGSELYLDRGDGEAFEKVRVLSGREAEKGMLVRFDGFETREDVAELNGMLLFIPSDRVKATEADSYYAFQLEGCQVYQGEELVGTVRYLIEAKANAYLEVEPAGGGEAVLIPFVRDVLLEVDLDAGRIRIPRGFLG